MRKLLSIAILTVMMGTHVDLSATNGFFLHGYSAKSSGMGGVGVAYPQDSVVASINPAGMYWVGKRRDTGLILFSPNRSYSYTGTPGFIPGDKVRSQEDFFAIPAIGYNAYYNPRTSLGFSIWANGGSNTNYPRNNPVFGTGRLGVDYGQFLFAPTVAYRLSENHSIGVSILGGLVRMQVRGLQNFAAFSERPSKVSNNGYSYAYGLGARIGWMGRVCNRLWLGASYSTKVWVTRLHGYTGLLADKGLFPIPENWIVGFRYEITKCMNIAVDYQRVYLSDSRPVGNPIQRIFEGIPLGAKKGGGFGWNDISIIKVGIDYKWNSCFTIRAGYDWGDLPYGPSQIDPNIVAPAVPQNHVTAGITYAFNSCCELDIAYLHAFNNTISGDSQFGLGRVEEQMYQNGLTISLGKKF